MSKLEDAVKSIEERVCRMELLLEQLRHVHKNPLYLTLPCLACDEDDAVFVGSMPDSDLDDEFMTAFSKSSLYNNVMCMDTNSYYLDLFPRVASMDPLDIPISPNLQRFAASIEMKMSASGIKAKFTKLSKVTCEDTTYSCYYRGVKGNRDLKTYPARMDGSTINNSSKMIVLKIDI